MKYNNSFLIICLIICLFSIASVAASDVNETVVANEDQSEEIITTYNQETDYCNVNEFNEEHINLNINDSDSNDKLSTLIQEEAVSSGENEDILGASQYTISSFSGPTSINYGSDGKITIILHPVNQDIPYEYHFYLDISNSLGTSLIWKEISGNTYNSPAALYNIKQISYSFSTNNLSPGTYTAKLVNNFGGSPLASYSFSVKNIFDAGQTNPSDYNYCSVNVEDTTIASSGKITMLVSCRHGYNFYLYVYDSKNNIKLSNNYYSDNGGTYSLDYNIYSNTLSSGTYTIKIINAKDYKTIDSAKLIMGNGISPTSPDSDDDGSTYDISLLTKDVKVVPGDKQYFTIKITPKKESVKFYRLI